jgi:exopolyphosphatase/pppGpp-phosphohydrolase
MHANNEKSSPPCVTESTRQVGAIDLGSKNFKFVFGQKVNGVITTELIRKERFELGKEVTENNGLIREERIAQVKQSLSFFVHYCRERGATDVLAITASAIRNARNYQRIRDVADEVGVNLELADGAREGEIGYFAATGGAPNKLVTEVGSKSMQVTWERDGEILSRSVSVGYEQAYESFIKHESTLREAEKRFHKFLDGNFREIPQHTDQYFALAANTATSFAAGELDSELERTLDRDRLDRAMARLRTLSASRFDELKASLPKAEKILPGLIFIHYIMERSGHSEMLVSPNELPVGLVVEYFLDPGLASV